MDKDTQIVLLQSAVRVIDVVALRGAIHGEDLYEVGSIRTGLLQLVTDLQQSDREADTKVD